MDTREINRNLTRTQAAHSSCDPQKLESEPEKGHAATNVYS
jgi:hypothetical protein